MVEEDFDDIPLWEYDEWCVKQLIEVDDEGVNTRIVVFLQSVLHNERIGIVLHPRMALKIGADIVLVAANE
jgi:hypothetical protein